MAQRRSADDVRVPRSRRWGSLVAALAALVVALVVIVLVVLDLLPAGLGTASVVAAGVWGPIGPQIVVVAVLATAVSLVALVRRRGFVTILSASGSVLALLLSAGVVVSVAGPGFASGGGVDPLAALTAGGPVRGPDEVDVYTVADAAPLQARVFAPARTAGAPVLVYVHGGGWIEGHAVESDGLAREYADLGWYVVNVDYRLASPTYPTWDKAPRDVGCALAWTARKALAAGADTGRTIVAGDSAGGHLAMLAGWSAAAGAAGSTCPELGPVPVPRGVVAGYPVANPGDAYDHGLPFFGSDPKDFTRDFLGGTPQQDPARLDAVSPATFAGPASPPTLVVQPERDDFIPAPGNYAVADLARARGVDVTVAGIPLTHHAFDVVPRSLGDQVRFDVVRRWAADRGLSPAFPAG